MGANDAAEMLEVAKQEIGQLERELAKVKAELDDVDAIARTNAMNMADFMGMRAERDAALAQAAEEQAVIERALKSLRMAHVPVTAIRAISEAENILSASSTETLREHDEKTWDECLDAIEEYELNTEQARAGNPYRKTPDGSE